MCNEPTLFNRNLGVFCATQNTMAITSPRGHAKQQLTAKVGEYLHSLAPHWSKLKFRVLLPRQTSFSGSDNYHSENRTLYKLRFH